MSEYTEVERPFLDQHETLGWKIIDQGCRTVPTDPALSLRDPFRQWLLPEVSGVHATWQYRPLEVSRMQEGARYPEHYGIESLGVVPVFDGW